MKQILLIEDEAWMARMLARVLREEGYGVEAVGDGRSGFGRAAADPWDLVILDWMLPNRSGVQILRGLRAAEVGVPVLLLTARDQVEDRVEGLDAGADDYLPKPFALAELLARVRALTRRPLAAPAGPAMTNGDLTLDPIRHAVRRGGEQVDLTAREFAFLHALLRRPGQVFTRAVLLEAVWGYPGDVSSNAVEVCVSHLRKKLDRAGAPSCIRTVRGFGYAFEPASTR